MARQHFKIVTILILPLAIVSSFYDFAYSVRVFRGVVEEMKETAERRENENPYSSISSDYRSK